MTIFELLVDGVVAASQCYCTRNRCLIRADSL